MMSRVCQLLCVLAALGSTSIAGAQFTVVPGAENTVTVSAFGVAEMPADWVEAHLPVKGSADTLESALMLARDQADRAVAELDKAGVAEAAIKRTSPQISAPSPITMQMPGGQNLRWTATIGLTVRIEKADPATLYDDIARAVDAVSGVTQADAAPGINVMEMMGGSTILTFGVKDPAALKKAAVSRALDDAATLAQAVAEKSGRAIGSLVSLQAMDLSQAGLMNVMAMFGGANKPAEASLTVMVSATYVTH